MHFSEKRLGLLYGLTAKEECEGNPVDVFSRCHTDSPIRNKCKDSGLHSESGGRRQETQMRKGMRGWIIEEQRDKEMEAMWKEYEQEDLESHLTRAQSAGSNRGGSGLQELEDLHTEKGLKEWGKICGGELQSKRRKKECDGGPHSERCKNKNGNLTSVDEHSTMLKGQNRGVESIDNEPPEKAVTSGRRLGKFRFKNHRWKKESDGCQNYQRWVQQEVGNKAKPMCSYSQNEGHHSSSSKKRRVNLEEKGYVRYKPDEPVADDDNYLLNNLSYQYANTDSAFRQLIFDAMADAEGAKFWEHVFGQRLDIFSPQFGRLNSMMDEDYAAYVLQKMYERSHEYISTERAEREQRKRKERKQKEREAQETERVKNERLRREEIRRSKKKSERLRIRWGEYLCGWAKILATAKDISQPVPPEKAIPWPVETGRFDDVSESELEKFYLFSPAAAEGRLHSLLKTERVKWHPDKVQQHWGTLEDSVLKKVNTIFQVVDSMWLQQREFPSKP